MTQRRKKKVIKSKRTSGYIVVWVTKSGRTRMEGPFRKIEYAKNYADEHINPNRVWSIEIYHVDKEWELYDAIKAKKYGKKRRR